jgi:hypothetical protein
MSDRKPFKPTDRPLPPTEFVAAIAHGHAARANYKAAEAAAAAGDRDSAAASQAAGDANRAAMQPSCDNSIVREADRELTVTYGPLASVEKIGGMNVVTPRPRAATRPERPRADAIELVNDGLYRVGGETFRVDEAADDVLQAFVDRPAMSKPELIEASGRANAARILRRLATPTAYGGKFAPFIHLPDRPNAGGFRVAIRRT